MHMRGRTLSLLLLTPALALGACGGGGSESDIKDIVKKVDANDSAICDYASKNLLKQLGGTKADCEKQARAYGSKDSTKVDGDVNVKVDGDTATATFKTTDKKDHTVGFVKEDGDWKVDTSE
jgi:hypothetical protein